MVYEGVCLCDFVGARVHKCMARARASVIVVGNMNAQSLATSLLPLTLSPPARPNRLCVRVCAYRMWAVACVYEGVCLCDFVRAACA